MRFEEGARRVGVAAHLEDDTPWARDSSLRAREGRGLLEAAEQIASILQPAQTEAPQTEAQQTEAQKHSRLG